MSTDGYFTMDEQCQQEYLHVHSSCFKRSFEDSSCRELVSLEPISEERQSFKDFKYSYVIPQGNISREGFLECKQDTWKSNYMVSELFGTVDMKHLDTTILKGSFGKRIDPNKQEKVYNYINQWVRDAMKKKLFGSGRKLGYGLASRADLGDHPLFSYYNRAAERKREKGKLVLTGKILYRKWYLWNGEELRACTVDSFKNRRHFLQVTPNYNKKTGSRWASINQLIPYTELKCLKFYELDENVDQEKSD